MTPALRRTANRAILVFINREGQSHKTLFKVQCCFTSTETVRTIRDGELGTTTSTFTQLLGSDLSEVQCCLTSTETIRTIREWDPRTAASTFTQLCFYFLFLPHPQESSLCFQLIRGTVHRTCSQSMLSEAIWTPNIASSQFNEYPELGSRSKSSPD